MLRLALRAARAHWRRFVLTTFAVVIGVSFVVGSFVLTDSLAGSIREALRDGATRSDLVVRPAGAGPGGGPGGVFGGPRAGLPVALQDTLRAVPGVAAADGVVSGPSQLLDKSGTAGAFDFALLSNWPDDPELFGVQLARGRAPTGPSDVVLDTRSARDRGVDVGDEVRIATRRGVEGFRVVGLAEQRAGGLVAAAPVLALSRDRATDLVGVPGWVGVVNVRVAEGADVAEVQQALRAVAGDSVSVVSSEALLSEAQAAIQDELNTFVGLLLGFAAVTLFVSAFLIWNTFTVVVAQRTRELALLRAVGATRRQVAGSVLGEGLVVGVAASVVGLGAGVLLAIGLRNLIGALGVELPAGELVVAPRTVLLGLGVGIVVTLVSVLGPARRATSVPPVAAIAAIDATPTRRTLGRPVLGGTLLAAGLVLGGRALADTTSAVELRVRGVGLGALLVFLGVAGVARFLSGPVIGAIGSPFRRWGGVATRVAVRNAVRNPRRTASTASALMIGLALVATTLVVGESVRTAIREGLARSVRAEVVVDSGSIAPFSAGSLERIAATPGVAGSVPLSVARSDTSRGPGRVTMATGDLDALVAVVDPEVVEGRLPAGAGEMAVARRWAEGKGVELGDRITLRSGGVTRDVDVVGVYARRELYDDTIVRPETFAGLPGVEPVTRLVFVRTDAAATPARVAAALSREVADVPNSSARVTSEFVAGRTSSVDVIIGIVNVLLLFAVLVAGLGIANTLALSVVERTRELGLLRAVGMARRRLRRMVRVEGVLIALFGGVLGLAVGVGFGAALVGVLPTENAEFTLPGWRLVGLVVVAGLLGVLASALPARRAGRLDVLRAIAEE